MVLSPEPNAFCMLKPGFNQYKDEFERLLKLNGWKIIKHCTKQFTRPEIEDFYIMHKDQGFYHKLCDYMITEACECYSCYKRCKDPYKEMGDFKKKIRDEWGEDEMRNGMHSSDNKENMLKECNIAFNTVNEKLKVSADNYITNRQFYYALEPIRNLDLQNIYGSVVSHFPDCYMEKDSKIMKIEVNVTNIIELSVAKYGESKTIKCKKYLTHLNENDPIDFMSQQDAKKILDYINEKS